MREDSHLKQRLYFTWQTTASFDTWDNDGVNWDNEFMKKRKKVGKIGKAQLREDSHLKQRLYFTWQTAASFVTWDNDGVNWDNDGVNGAYVITMIIREIIYEII